MISVLTNSLDFDSAANGMAFKMYEPSHVITFSGPGTNFLAAINCTNGVVTVNTNIPMDEGAREFWRVLQEGFPGSFEKRTE